jgi:hypothetical protein
MVIHQRRDIQTPEMLNLHGLMNYAKTKDKDINQCLSMMEQVLTIASKETLEIAG